MFCPQCGNKLKDDATFCGKCGVQLKVNSNSASRIKKQNPVQNNQNNFGGPKSCPNPSFNKQNINKDQGKVGSQNQYGKVVKTPKVKTSTFKIKPWQIALIVTGGVLLLAAIVGVIIWVSITTRQSDESKAKSDLENSWVISDGVISNDYCKKNSYSLEDFEVINITTNPNGSTKKEVSYSATIKNDNFQSEIEGSVNYSNSDKVDVKVSHKETVPIKGVDFFQKTEDEAKTKMEGEKTEGGAKNSTSANTYAGSIIAYTSYTTYTSYATAAPIVQDGQKFKCDATADRTIERWFVKDKATVRQSFEFDAQNGWKSTGKETLDNKHVEYTLNGVEMVSASTEAEAGSHKLVFNSIDANGNGAVNYTITYKPSQSGSSSSSSNYQYHNINLSGTATGTISHTYGETWFKFEFNDASKGVSFVGDDTTSTSNYSYNSAGDPREDFCLQASINTKAAYYTYSGTYSSSSSYFKREHLLFKKNDA